MWVFIILGVILAVSIFLGVFSLINKNMLWPAWIVAFIDTVIIVVLIVMTVKKII